MAESQIKFFSMQEYVKRRGLCKYVKCNAYTLKEQYVHFIGI